MSRLRIALALVGFIAALLSVTLDDHRLAWAAIALLTASLLLRFILRRRNNRHSAANREV